MPSLPQSIVVFDLDETLGHFAQLGLIWDCMRSHYHARGKTLPRFAEVMDAFPEYQRPDVFAAQSWERDMEALGKGEFFVAGDNGYRSVDSRVWGPLRRQYIFGTAQWIVSPSHFGPIPQGPFETQAQSK